MFVCIVGIRVDLGHRVSHDNIHSIHVALSRSDLLRLALHCTMFGPVIGQLTGLTAISVLVVDIVHCFIYNITLMTGCLLPMLYMPIPEYSTALCT